MITKIILFALLLPLNIFYILNNLYFYQIKNYKIDKYLHFFKNKKRIIINSLISVLACICLIFIENAIIYTVFSCFLVIFYIIFEIVNYFAPKKISLKFTHKIKRLFISNLIIIFAINLLLSHFASTKCFTLVACGSMLYKDVVIFIINMSWLPYEKLINKKFMARAKQKLRSQNIEVIGITGSVGKTSVKNYLSTLLGGHNAVASPLSYNTPLGLTKAINNLDNNCEIFIAEMGARKRHQIEELCRLTNPTNAIITNVSPAHIETFGSVENIYKTKKELADYCKGTVIYNIDNEYVKKMYDERKSNKISVSINQNADYFATDIKFGLSGSSFILHTGGKEYEIHTCLIGKHNVQNLTLAIACACLYDDIENILPLIDNVKAEPHRLELIENANGVHIIDDSYNASADSIRVALEVLSSIDARKIIASPGMIEGGKMQYDINFNFGASAGKFVDYFIIVNDTNKKAITDGLLSVGFKNIMYAKNLAMAKEFFSKLLRSGDCLLLLNDLPDDYN